MKTRKIKTTKTKIFLLSIFLVTVIPTIIVYLEHASVEANAYEKAKTETKQIKTLSEAVLFASIGLGYLILTWIILFYPEYSKIPYIIVIVGTSAVVYLWLFRIYGIPIPFTDIVITDFSTDWRDVITKTCQSVLVIPASILLVMREKK